MRKTLYPGNLQEDPSGRKEKEWRVVLKEKQPVSLVAYRCVCIKVNEMQFEKQAAFNYLRTGSI
jgi:hypothetical protein